MTSDDDEELDEEEDGTLQGTHAEDATIFTLPPSPVTSYEPATKPSELPVKSEVSNSAAKPVKPVAKKVASPAKKAAPAKKLAPKKLAAKKAASKPVVKKAVATKTSAKKPAAKGGAGKKSVTLKSAAKKVSARRGGGPLLKKWLQKRALKNYQKEVLHWPLRKQQKRQQLRRPSRGQS